MLSFRHSIRGRRRMAIVNAVEHAAFPGRSCPTNAVSPMCVSPPVVKSGSGLVVLAPRAKAEIRLATQLPNKTLNTRALTEVVNMAYFTLTERTHHI